MSLLEIETIEELRQHLDAGGELSGTVLQALDLRPLAGRLAGVSLQGAVFLGCRVPPELNERLAQQQVLVFPRIEGVPYDAYRGQLYTPQELMGDYEPGGSYARTHDDRIYRHFLETGGPSPTSILETLARRLHDHAITDAMNELIAGRRVVAVMGGHAMGRDDQQYLQVARISRLLTRAGFLMTSGGGPGAMEATHVGAWFARRTEDELAEGVWSLAQAPLYKPRERWLDTALEVQRRYPLQDDDPPQSLGVPTWLYGHEPPTVFATCIAKYFANSVREEGLLAIARHGVIYAPGSAGTIQEIFQDATQNHYRTMGVISPMVFFGEAYWKWTKPVFPLLTQLAAGHEYASLIHASDSVQEVVQIIERHAASGPADR